VNQQALSITLFLLFVAATIGITYWASKNTKTATDFYAGGRSFSGVQNGLAIGGDYMSAASFLGIAGMIALYGYDGFLYSIGFLVAWLVALLLVAELMRNSGKFTMADVLAFRMSPVPVRTAAGVSTITVSIFYLLAQMVGAGALVGLLLGLESEAAKAGTIPPEASEIVARALEMPELRVADVMVPRQDAIMLPVDAGLDELLRVSKEHPFNRLPVYEERIDNVVGYVSMKDLLPLALERAPLEIGKIMRPPFFVPDSKRAVELLEEMRQRRLPFAIVVDEQGGVSGIVTFEDLVEELVGDIFSEHTKKVPLLIKKENGGSAVVNGATGHDRIYDGWPDVALEMVDHRTFDGRLQLLEYVPTVLDGPPGTGA